MLFADLVATSGVVSSTRSRLAKRDALADLLRRAEPSVLDIVVTYLAGDVRQRRDRDRGGASLRDLPAPADQPSLTMAGIDAELQRISELSGPGSVTGRTAAVQALFAAATTAETGLPARAAVRRNPPRGLGLGDGGCDRHRERPSVGRGSAGGDAARGDRSRRRGRAGRRLGRPVHLDLRAADPADAGFDGGRRGHGAGQGRRAGVGGRQTRRHPHPGAQGPNRYTTVHPQSGRHHYAAARGGGSGAGAARRTGHLGR